MLGVAMVTGVSFIAVLEHHFATVDPGKLGTSANIAMHFFIRSCWTGNILCSLGHQPSLWTGHLIYRD